MAVLGAFREAAYDAPDLAGIAARIELALARQDAGGRLVTAVLALFPADGSRAEVLNSGILRRCCLRAGGACFIEPRQASLPLGLSELAAVSREPVSARFGPSDQILFYTDGISEARDRAGEFYPLERISAVIRGHDLDAALSLLAEDLIRYVGHPLADDAAMLLIRNAARPGGANGTPVSTASSRVQSGSETGAALL